MLRSWPKRVTNRKMLRYDEGLPIGLNCTKEILASQTPISLQLTYIRGKKTMLFFPVVVGSGKKLLQKSGSEWPMDRRSSLRGGFVCVKTHKGLGRFEVGKFRLWWKICTFAPGPEGCAIQNCSRPYD